MNFYPRSPCGERLCKPLLSIDKPLFLSTLSLRRATLCTSIKHVRWIFLSTLSLRRATLLPTTLAPSSSYFYPRSPCGERLVDVLDSVCQLVFLSTLSLRRATPSACYCLQCNPISIHALLAESDVFSFRFFVFDLLFLSTLSLRRATDVSGELLR